MAIRSAKLLKTYRTQRVTPPRTALLIGVAATILAFGDG
jgi:hypothetical protein